ncbi:unnamed protein product [Polarella glacialis]|uniref:Uncharacterized protein n=1 Tax=Polarella glacialis TaxID=89957 RepID=A0A813HAA0_POLGL|nr:unnamed protein product [Polarella glacialis]
MTDVEQAPLLESQQPSRAWPLSWRWAGVAATALMVLAATVALVQLHACGLFTQPADSVLQLSQQLDDHDLKPIGIAPCNLSETAQTECPQNCGDVAGYHCEAPGWVFCINAECASQPVIDPESSKPVVLCKCWQPNNTISSILPSATNSGASCVLNAGEGGKKMCEKIKAGELWSTYGPNGTLLEPLESAVCAPHTPWAWCWGAPCHREEKGGEIICRCPYMTSTNEADQPVSLAGKSECAGNPCDRGLHNSMPAGSSPNQQTACYNSPSSSTTTT